MNHQKTKTIQQVKRDSRGLVSILLLFLLLGSCGRAGNSKSDNITNDAKGPKEDFIKFVGGWGPCGFNCLGDQLISDARAGENNKGGKKKNVTVGNETVETYVLPKHKMVKGENDKEESKPYFKGIATQPFVGDKKKRKMFSRKKDKSPLQLQEGISGKFAELLQKFLVEDSSDTALHPRVFVVAKYLGFSEEVKNILEGKGTKENVISKLNEALTAYDQDVDKVRSSKEAKGVRIVIPVNEQKTAKEGGIIFQDLAQNEKSKNKKGYVLNKDLEDFINGIIAQIKTEITNLESKL